MADATIWLEGRGPYLTLIGAVDDATGMVPWACLRHHEDAQGYLQLLSEVVRRRGCATGFVQRPAR